jgi:LuxR family maltose regulon positive regulatory protein
VLATVVSAPAGFGKTTLLAEWLATSEAGQGRAAWVALDQSDNEPALFWAYFIAALQRLDAQIGKNTHVLLHSPQPVPVETLLGTLRNEVDALGERVVLVLETDPSGHRVHSRPSAAAVAAGHRWPSRPAIATAPPARAANWLR